jgi:osmotically-inducible protein OsmY
MSVRAARGQPCASLYANFVVAFLLASGLWSCSAAGVAVSTGASAITAAQTEKGFGASVSDAAIELALKAKLLDLHESIFWRLTVEVQEGRVLLAGTLPTVEQRIAAVMTAWQTDGVREVINEIRVDRTPRGDGMPRDAWITARLSTALLFDKEVSAINYSLETVDGIIYLMGVARSREELERVMAHAKEVSYVKRVVSYVRVAGANGASGTEP